MTFTQHGGEGGEITLIDFILRPCFPAYSCSPAASLALNYLVNESNYQCGFIIKVDGLKLRR